MKKIMFFTAIFVQAMLIASCQRSVVVHNTAVPKTAQLQPRSDIGIIPDEAVQDIYNQDIYHKEILEKAKKEVPHTMPSVKERVSENTYYKGRAVVLTYHHISNKPVSSITIKPERFEKDLIMLNENFNVISFEEMIKSMKGEYELPDNAVVITFDDGYESFYKYAYPLLKKYNTPAINFIVTSWTESYEANGRDLNLLSPEQIKEMYESGLVDIGSHTHNGHEYIIKNEKEQLGGVLAYQIFDKATGTFESQETYEKRVIDDLKKSMEVIKEYTGDTTKVLCFPFGHYNSRLLKLSREAGFEYFVTTIYGNNKENSNKTLIWRIRSGDAKLTPEKLKESIINCGTGKPLS
ncbi:poly-beta-1,6-N-acetyl-D-glucosamine N-deacetylase precursor [Oxobacter pfennigii]|uniref:Poly-beta-1,6-N-acetyl-D-glucosamine N-deacetylase n=1 Tax=Oxobacter pfennigii TaxID=36849 RepID=A0A0P8W9J2_9CLOT|nr:polysaccharide deacetylase family protein [Oxobacter pfennigii]KPU44647.1 poly-beta-1,6-N-acetyl-D-glucosamine N-deacetylase precursor [Oxobacter pfennigii]